MTGFPFHLKIRNAFSIEQSESVTCKSILRTVTGKREVYDALWNGQSVIAKVFFDCFKGLYALKKEWRGLIRLQKLGLNSPKTLFWGKTQDGKWALVTEKIPNSSTAADIFNALVDKSKKNSLLKLVCGELARQHSRGVRQTDLHLGNFLVAGERVFAIDPAEIKFHASPLSKRQSTLQLAALACYLPTEDTTALEELCREYFAARDWGFERCDLQLLLKKIDSHRRHSTEKWLRKILRTGTRYLKVKADGCIAVFNRTFCDAAEAESFIKQIDSLMDKGEILKNGNTCYVSALTWQGKKIVVKRYNHKSLLLSVYSAIHGSRAKLGWLHGHRLNLLNIATPKPVAFVERYKQAVIWNSYLVTEYVEGQKLVDFMENGKVSSEEKAAVAQKIVGLLGKLSRRFISHGDLKHSNILVTADGPVLTDLDGMKVHKCKWLGRYGSARDMEKFVTGTKGNYDITDFIKK